MEKRLIRSYHASAVQNVLGFELVKLTLNVFSVLETRLALLASECIARRVAYKMDGLALALQHSVEHAANPSSRTVKKPRHLK